MPFVCGKKQLGFGICMTVGIVLVIVFAALPTLVNQKIEEAILKGTIITNPGAGLTQKQYDDWIAPNVEIDYYLWNITNLKDVLLTGVKPIVRETGPFGYSKTKTKYNVTFFDDEATGASLVSYNEATMFVPLLEGKPLSNSSATFMDGSKAIITTVNVPYLVAISSTALPEFVDSKKDGSGNDGNSGNEGQFHVGVGITVSGTTHGTVFNDSHPSSFVAGFRAASISSMLQLVIRAAGLAGFSNTDILNDFVGSGAWYNETCASCPDPRTTCIFGFANTSGNYYHCGFSDAFLTVVAKTETYANNSNVSFQGVFELPRPVPLTATDILFDNPSNPYSLLSIRNSSWPLVCTGSLFLNCSVKFAADGAQDTCTTVCMWIGGLSSKAGDTNSYLSPTKATKYRWMVNYVLQNAPHAANVANTPNVYNVPWMQSWDDFAALQFSKCTIMRIASGITPFGFTDDLSAAERFACSVSSASPATSMGLALEPCAQTFKLASITPYRWRPTLAEASTFLSYTNNQIGFLSNVLAPLSLSPLPLDQLKLAQLTDFLVYTGRYFALLPRAISNIAGNGFIPPWDAVTGVPQWNQYGTGLGYAPTMGPFVPGPFAGGSGLFTTRYAQEFLFGYQSGEFLVSSTGAFTFSSGLQGPNITTLPADNSAAKPKITIYTGADGDKTRITFYKKYYDMESIEFVNDFYDSKTSPNRKCEGSNSIPRYGFAFLCRVWLNKEKIDGLSDGFKAPYTFNEDGAATDMNVWVSEGWRAVNFQKTSDITFKDIKMWKYTMDPRALMNLTVATATGDARAIANAKQYFMTNHPSGVASRQRSDAVDFFVSLPHFLGGDIPFYKNQLDIDLSPNEDTHLTYLAVDPLSGRTMSGRKRLQLGVFLSSKRLTNSTFRGLYSNLTDKYIGNTGQQDNFPATGEANTAAGNGSCANNLYIPIFWASEGKDISDSDASDFVTKIYGTRKTFQALQIALVLIGGVTFLGFLVLCIMSARAPATGTAV